MKPLILLAAIIISFPASAQSTFKSLRPLQEQLDDITDRFHAPRNVLNEEAPAPRKYPKPHSPDYSQEILMRRDGVDEFTADDIIATARERVQAGEDPEEVLREEFGLEPDYIFELMGL